MSKTTGPITAGRRGHPFSAYLGDIADVGYVEEEYFLEGTGSKYSPSGETTPDGKWTLSVSGSAPFKTRMLVRRPRDPAKFNGVVIVEWLNVTVGYDTSTIGPVSDGIYRNGFAYVGVTCQRVGVEGFSQNPQGLKVWDPDRYGSLSIPADSISYDILSQAGRAVGPARPRDGVDPLRGLQVRKVIATGASQSAGRLRSYINGVHPLARVFDGFLPVIDFGLGFGFGDLLLDPSAGMPSPQRTFIRTRIRDDIDVPVFIVNSETEALLFFPSQQADSARFRFWDVAGASHVPAKWSLFLLKMQERDGLPPGDQTLGSQVMWEPTADAALSHLAAWMQHGTEPPRVSPIQVKLGEAPEIVRDEFGNAVGGVRLPEVEVPVAHYEAAIRTLSGTEGLRGTTTPLPAETLARLYPTHAVYVARVAKAARAAEAAGVIESARVAEYIAEAKNASIGGVESSSR